MPVSKAKPKTAIKKKATKTVTPKKELTQVGYSVIINDKDEYELVTLKYDIESKQAKVAKVEKFADKQYQAVHKFKLMMAKGKIIPSK